MPHSTHESISNQQLLPYHSDKKLSTKHRLITAAIDCLAIDGLEQTSFEAIGKKLGIGRAHVRYHYRNKEELFIAAVDFVTQTQQRITAEFLSQKACPLDQLKAVVSAAFKWREEHPNQNKVWALFWYFSATKPDYRALHAQLRGQSAARIGQIVSALSQRHLRAEERGLLAKSIQAMITGELIENANDLTGRHKTATEERVWANIWKLLEGYAVVNAHDPVEGAAKASGSSQIPLSRKTATIDRS